MMSLLKTIQMFVSQNPGLTNKQIAAALPEYDVQSVQRAVCRLVDTKRATRKHAGKCYRYYAEAPQGPIGEVIPRQYAESPKATCEVELEKNSKFTALEMIEKAKELSKKGFYHRAATVLLEAFTQTRNNDLREKILSERQRCLRMVQRSKTSQDAYYLSGKFAGGSF